MASPRCPNCDQLLKEGQEIKGTFYAYFHAVPSRRVISTTRPHDFIAESLQHANCMRANGDDGLLGW